MKVKEFQYPCKFYSYKIEWKSLRGIFTSKSIIMFLFGIVSNIYVKTLGLNSVIAEELLQVFAIPKLIL